MFKIFCFLKIVQRQNLHTLSVEKVHMVSLKDQKEDKWVWTKNSYSVKEAYSLILYGYVTEKSRDLAVVCNDLVPFKVSVLAWRLLENRILTKSNLVRRGTLNESQVFCLFGCGCGK